MLHPDPQEGREVHQDREDKEAMEHPGLAEHDSIHEDSRNGASWGSRHTDVVRSDGGGISHVAGRVAHAQQTKDAYGDHSPTAHVSPATRPMGPGLSSIARDNSAHRASQRGMIHPPSTEEEAAEMHRGGGSTATTKMFGPG